MSRESMEFDVVIVGAGPAGLAAAIRLRQLAEETGREISVTVLEKGSEVGAHILSGAVFEPRALDELIPDWKEKGAPLNTPARADEFRYLTRKGGIRMPGAFLPPQMRNHGNYIISLGNLCRWLGQQAEELGVEVYPGFAAAEVLYHEDGRVKGVATGDMGIARGRHPEGELRAGRRAAREVHAVRRRRPRLAHQATGRAVRSAQARGPADLRHRAQGGLGDRARQAPAGPDPAQLRLAAGQPHLRRLLPLSLRREPGLDRLRRGTRLREPAPFALRRVPTLQDPSADPPRARRGPAAGLRRARDQRGRIPVDPGNRLPWRCVDRLCRGLPQRAQDQGQPQRDEERRARGRGGHSPRWARPTTAPCRSTPTRRRCDAPGWSRS